MKSVIIVGAGGHGKVVADIIEKSRDFIVGFLDDQITKSVFGYRILGNIDLFQTYKKEVEFVIAIGNNTIRQHVVTIMQGVQWYTAIHPMAVLAKDVKIGKGSVVMANAVINSSAKIGRHCIINTGAVVEHDNIIDDYVHLSPQVTLGGTVKVGKSSHIGIGAVVKNNITICSDVVVGAGGCVVKNIEKNGIYVGVPVKKI